MEFFNKKEEVIDLKLTQFGRFLLSKGKFKPVFYSFYDDNVLYDVSKAGLSELQNESEIRIKETPTMHHQISFSPLEKDFNSNYNKVLSGEESPISEDLQRTAEKHYALPSPIGTSDINSEYSPSWTANFLNGNISGSVNYLIMSEKTGGKNTQIIPQINSEMEIKVLDHSSEEVSNFDELESGFSGTDIEVVSNEEDMFVLLKLSENNGLFQKKNFDIEIYEIQEEDQDGTIIESLRPLSFSMLPEATSETSFVDEAYPEEDVTHVEYYFDVLVDDEIEEELLCALDPTNEKMGVFADPRTLECQEIINKNKKKNFDIYTDESDYPGEIC